MKLLHLDSSIQGGASASRAISAAVVERLRAGDPSLDVVYRDLAADPIAHLTLDALAAPQATAILEEFQSADIVVIGAGLYNFTIPSQLKAWIDRILIAGQTFRWTENGPVGLVTGKRAIVALARGAAYAEGSPVASWEHAETLLRLTLEFVGITDAEFIIAEGLAFGEEARKASTEAAVERARQIQIEPLAA
jgi:FMN-dependent NADH-azoreductase